MPVTPRHRDLVSRTPRELTRLLLDTLRMNSNIMSEGDAMVHVPCYIDSFDRRLRFQ